MRVGVLNLPHPSQRVTLEFGLIFALDNDLEIKCSHSDHLHGSKTKGSGVLLSVIRTAWRKGKLRLGSLITARRSWAQFTYSRGPRNLLFSCNSEPLQGYS